MVYKVRWNIQQRDRFVKRWLKFRERYSLTQEQLAQAMGIHVATVHRVEAGRFVPSNDTVLRFGDVERRFKDGETIAGVLAWNPGNEEEI